jgi:hypothetical protein
MLARSEIQSVRVVSIQHDLVRMMQAATNLVALNIYRRDFASQLATFQELHSGR